MNYRGRFAPSPTGALHLGSLLVAVGSWLRARSQRGVWIVRMEDLDPAREVPGAARVILDTLAGFGLSSDEPVWYQSQRAEIYSAALIRLQNCGVAFSCGCSRSDLQKNHGLHLHSCEAPANPIYQPAWRVRAPDQVMRFDDLLQGPQQQNLRAEVGDFIVHRAEGHAAYQLAVVVDDAAQGITEVMRGADLIDSTARQIFLQRTLDFAVPDYLHLPLLLDAHGQKLSKQNSSLAVDARDPLPALRAVLDLLGIAAARLPRVASVDSLLHAAITLFDAGRLPRRGTLDEPMLHPPNANE
ncbi:tRNA glutamyl-Q(34) synthetase GluQRS [Pseudolysobacter antarcticus]|uniref:Glutamyl-Q tRNA(Asp) synthetase n=1 Tax=Pseudolysobacter antarcticus TaxID=2511995 RepID=A0A411HQF1_9GAMM|nr:tRNA glutamyl-Q(34) synthetase GluQRS [Pseudolysobacter antarcticus]QBB72686.1 tRNA glutamyl-Q(34) synthetase GluQRS [Pseudolysobacter antarcticus]